MKGKDAKMLKFLSMPWIAGPVKKGGGKGDLDTLEAFINNEEEVTSALETILPTDLQTREALQKRTDADTDTGNDNDNDNDLSNLNTNHFE